MVQFILLRELRFLSALPFYGMEGKSVIAGPLITFPNLSNLDPWQGQSQVFSDWFHATMPPK
jgi:hypothetical protein